MRTHQNARDIPGGRKSPPHRVGISNQGWRSFRSEDAIAGSPWPMTRPRPLQPCLPHASSTRTTTHVTSSDCRASPWKVAAASTTWWSPEQTGHTSPARYARPPKQKHFCGGWMPRIPRSIVDAPSPFRTVPCHRATTGSALSGRTQQEQRMAHPLPSHNGRAPGTTLYGLFVHLNLHHLDSPGGARYSPPPASLCCSGGRASIRASMPRGWPPPPSGRGGRRVRGKDT